MGDKKPNTNQHEAIAMILDPNPTPPILVIGPFGTGKTFTLNLACVSILSQSPRNKVLICTHSNSAADIHLEHLNAKIENNPLFNQLRPLRVLNLFRKVMTVPKVLRKYCLVEGIQSFINIYTCFRIAKTNNFVLHKFYVCLSTFQLCTFGLMLNFPSFSFINMKTVIFTFTLIYPLVVHELQ